MYICVCLSVFLCDRAQKTWPSMGRNNQGADFENFDLKNIISKRSQTDWPCRADICTVVKTSKEALCRFFKTLAPSKYDEDDDDIYIMIKCVFVTFLLFSAPRWVFMVFHSFRLVPGRFLWLPIIPGWFFMVPGRFSWFVMVLGWFFMVFLQNVPAPNSILAYDPV